MAATPRRLLLMFLKPSTSRLGKTWMVTHPRGAPHQLCLTQRSIAIVNQRQPLAGGDGWHLGLVYIIILAVVATNRRRKHELPHIATMRQRRTIIEGKIIRSGSVLFCKFVSFIFCQSWSEKFQTTFYLFLRDTRGTCMCARRFEFRSSGKVAGSRNCRTRCAGHVCARRSSKIENRLARNNWGQ